MESLYVAAALPLKPLSSHAPSGTMSWYSSAMMRTGSPPCLRFPAHPGRQPGLSPLVRFTSGDVDWASTSTRHVKQAIAKGIEVIEHDLVLNSNVAILHFVEPRSEMPEDRSGIHALVDSQERHADARQVVRRKRPETPVGISIFGTYPGMKHERPEARDSEDTLGEDVLAECDDEVGLRCLDE